MDIIIALGHSGYDRDLEVAARAPHVDVVVGGHTHSFLYSPRPGAPNPSVEKIRGGGHNICNVMQCHVMWRPGPYPSLVNNTAGHKTLVVQAYAHTKVGGVGRHCVILLTHPDTLL